MSYPETPFTILGQSNLGQLYPTATPDELEATWQEQCGSPHDEYIQTKQALGALRKPETPPSVIVSVDLCEVVRETHLGIREFEELPGTRPHKEPYGYDMGIIRAIQGTDEADRFARQVQCMSDMGRLLISNDLIKPDPHTPGIAAFLRNWRRNGAYVFANTASGEGTEAGTVRFLGQHLPGAFDGIIFSRNYTADPTKVRKGSAAREAVDHFNPDQPAALVHIDDSIKHLASFRDSFGERPDTSFATFQARYEGVDEHADSQGSHHRLETFAMADRHIKAELARLSIDKR